MSFLRGVWSRAFGPAGCRKLTPSVSRTVGSAKRRPNHLECVVELPFYILRQFWAFNLVYRRIYWRKSDIFEFLRGCNEKTKWDYSVFIHICELSLSATYIHLHPFQYIPSHTLLKQYTNYPTSTCGYGMTNLYTDLIFIRNILSNNATSTSHP